MKLSLAGLLFVGSLDAASAFAPHAPRPAFSEPARKLRSKSPRVGYAPPHNELSRLTRLTNKRAMETDELVESSDRSAKEETIPSPLPPLVNDLDLKDAQAEVSESESKSDSELPVDQGKEIFLASIAETDPDEIFVIDVGIKDNQVALVAPSDKDAVEESVEKSDVVSGSSLSSEDGNFIVAEDRESHVSAILAVSSEAVAAAEASMPQDLIKQLEFGSNGDRSAANMKSNSTIVSTLVDIDELPEILSASSVVGEPATKPATIETPGVRKILKFAIPAIGVWLCGPLLSLIDTSAVGVLSGTAQQAALNPAVAVTDYAALLIAFMYTGTTNLVAAAQENDRGVPGKPRTAKTLIGAMQLSTFVGLGLGSALFVFARPLLRAIIGNDAISPAVFSAAMKYVRIRALGMPAAAIIGSAQAACLGMQDIRSPLYVLLAAAIVNFFGDVFFVGNSHPLIGGAAGAAWATVFSQYAAVALFVRWLCNKPERSSKPRVMNLTKAIMEMTGSPESEGEKRRKGLRNSLASFVLPRKVESKVRKSPVGALLSRAKNSIKKPKSVNTAETVSVRGFLKDRFKTSDLVKFPSKESRDEFSSYVVPVTTTVVGRVSGYISMSHVVASSMGTIGMAAQQILVSLFYCLCPIADSLSLTAQSFLPAISERPKSPERTEALKKTTRSFVKAGGIFGAAMVAAVTTIPILSGFFTSDPAVIAMVNSAVPMLIGFFATHGVLCAMEGVLMGQKDLGFLGKMYGAYFLGLPMIMLRVKRAALAGNPGANLAAVWKVFLGYQIFRTVAWAVRNKVLERRASKEDAKVAAASRVAP